VAREGLPFILIPLAAAAGAALAGWGPVAAALAVLGLLCAGFFRDPDRRAPEDPAAILAPADGRVTAVERAPEGLRISIFLSVFDVHVNRAPVSGRVESVRYTRGRFHNAMNEVSAAENERNDVRVATDRGPVEVTQIAGLIARRIVCRVKAGDRLATGDRFGLIRFGSRTDLRLPPGAEPAVVPGARVAGGETIVARWSAA